MAYEKEENGLDRKNQQSKLISLLVTDWNELIEGQNFKGYYFIAVLFFSLVSFQCFSVFFLDQHPV